MHEHRVLVVSPHTDDELFGCGGALLKMKQSGNVRIKLVVLSCTNRYLRHLKRIVTADEQWEEFKLSAKYLSTEQPARFDLAQRLEETSMYRVVARLDSEIDAFQPTTILIPEPSYHQEHKLTYEASIAACRPTYGKPVLENIFLYEIPTNTWSGATSIFKPNTYIDVSEQIEEKVRIFKEVYKVQYDEKRNMLGADGIVTYANYRGTESGLKFAESFMLIKSARNELV